MPYCQIVENPGAGQEQFARVKAHVRAGGPFPPDGQALLIAGPGERGWRVITVWETEEAMDRFYRERFPVACREAGVSLDGMTRTVFEVDTLLTGDLAGAAQPA
jgi:hypothetical protein